ncbi:MAG: hypothetical protein E3K37_02150 [Candidatus Kuenenia sp.]|nr:hypothetical protein [Candidatus Kuenenia hertensis]
MHDCFSDEKTKISLIEKFIEEIISGKKERMERFYEIFSARGFSLELEDTTGNVRLSDESHGEDGEFLEILQNIGYKKIYNTAHQDAINNNDSEDASQKRHAYFDYINTQLFDINNMQYVIELFSNKIPVDMYRLNWERDRYGRFEQFKACEQLPKIRVSDLEPFIARLTKAVSSIGISTWSSCEGHWGDPAYIKCNGKYHRLWFQALFNTFIKKRLDLVCNWEWLGWDDRCFIRHPEGNLLELYLEIQKVACLVHNNRTLLRNTKKQTCQLLTHKHKSMNQKKWLNIFQKCFEESFTHNALLFY